MPLLHMLLLSTRLAWLCLECFCHALKLSHIWLTHKHACLGVERLSLLGRQFCNDIPPHLVHLIDSNKDSLKVLKLPRHMFSLILPGLKLEEFATSAESEKLEVLLSFIRLTQKDWCMCVHSPKVLANRRTLVSFDRT